MNQSKRVKWVLVRFFVMGLLLLATSNFAFAQVTASMNGKVVDASGATIPGAMVSVISLETGATRTVTADDMGNYQILSLPVGRYEVKAEKAGFKTAVQTGITLTVGQQAVVSLSLEVGQVQQQVTVTAEAPLVNTTTASTSGLIGEQEVKDLPLNGRSFDQLITLNAGASNTTNLRGLQVGSGGVGASQGQWFTVSGNRMSENQFLWNGVEYMGPSITHAVPGGVSGQLLGVDAVREFNVESNTYGAQYGKRSGGQISIVTTSGTNQLHGSAFEFLRNSAFDARNFFDPDPSLIGRRIPQFQRNQFGGSLGGPIIKGKTFVFGNYEGFRQRLGVSNTSIVPDTCARAGLTSPAAAQATPYTLSQCGPAYSGQPAANAAGATMKDIIDAYWPAPNGAEKGSASGQANAAYNPKQSIQEDFGTARVDHNFSQKDTLSGNYLIDDGFSVTPIVNPLFFQAFGIRSQVIGLQETHVFSNNVINTFTVGFSRSAITFTSAPYVPISSTLYFALGQFPNPGRPNIGGGFTAGGGSNTSHLLNVRNLFTYQDQVQIIKGRHQISVGGLITPLGSNENDSKNTSGSASFANISSFFTGVTTSFTVTPTIAPKYWRQIEGAWFVQDTIQVRPNLTVTLGVRHEFTNGYREKYGHAANLAIDPTTNIPLTNYRVGDNTYTDNNARLLFGPRVGIAWDPFGKGRTSIRAGYGTHFSTIDTLGHSFMDANPPFSGQASFSNTAFLPLVPVDASIPVAPACGPGAPAVCTTFAAQGVQANLKMPTIQEWSLSVEQQLTPNTSLRVGYVGTHGYHGQLEGDPNQIPSQLCTNAAGCSSGGTMVKTGTPAISVPQGTRYIPAAGAVGTITTAKLPNPFLAVGVMLYDESNSSYNGLNVELQHRFSAGLQFKGAYTWSKSLDTLSGLNSGTDGGAGSIYDIVQPKLSYGPSNYNQTHKFVFNGSYDLPVGRGKHWLNGATGITDKVVGGWKVNTIVTAQSGFPFTVLMGINWIGNGETASGGNTGSPPSYNTAFTGNPLPHTVDHWFDAHAYTLPNVGGTPTIGTFGNVSRNSIVGPNMRNVDISLFKTTSITERVSLQFRAEVFNVLNRANFGTPTNVAFSGTTGVGAGATPSYNASAGQVFSAATSRQIQFGLKLQF